MSANGSLVFKIAPNKKLLLWGMVFLPLLLSLGVWQLDRAEQKQQLLDAQKQLVAQQPVDLSALAESDLGQFPVFTPVSFTGDYHPEHYWLLDNQIHLGQFGYHLLQPVRLQHQWVLVDRGWLPGPTDRELPTINWQQMEHQFTGSIASRYKNPLLAGADIESDDPRIVAVDLPALSKQSGLDLAAFIRLDAGDDQALVVDFVAVNIHPEKHVAYAVQWFCMAAALLILLVFANTNLLYWLQQKNRIYKNNHSKGN